MANADETAIYLHMPPNYTLVKKGVKEELLKTTGCEKLHLTVMLAATADGRKLPPLLILKRKTLPKSEAFSKDVIVRGHRKKDGWQRSWCWSGWKFLWGRRPRVFLNQPSVLVLDAFKEHLTDSAKNLLYKMKTEFAVIPGEMTSLLQPMDVSISKPFKDRLRQQYLTWNADPACELTETGKILHKSRSGCRLRGKPTRRALSSDLSRSVA